MKGKENKMARKQIHNVDWNKLYNLITRKNMTVGDFTEELGFERSYISKQKSNGWIYSSTLEYIAFKLNIDPSELLMKAETKLKNNMDRYIIEQFGEIRAVLSAQTKLINALTDDLIVLHREIKQTHSDEHPSEQ